MTTRLEDQRIDQAQSGGSRTETYYDIDILKIEDRKKTVFMATVWSEKSRQWVEFVEFDIEDLKNLLNTVLVDNFYRSLTEITENFGSKSAYNFPEENLELLKLRLQRMLNIE